MAKITVYGSVWSSDPGIVDDQWWRADVGYKSSKWKTKKSSYVAIFLIFICIYAKKVVTLRPKWSM